MAVTVLQVGRPRENRRMRLDSGPMFLFRSHMSDCRVFIERHRCRRRSPRFVVAAVAALIGLGTGTLAWRAHQTGERRSVIQRVLIGAYDDTAHT